MKEETGHAGRSAARRAIVPPLKPRSGRKKGSSARRVERLDPPGPPPELRQRPADPLRRLRHGLEIVLRRQGFGEVDMVLALEMKQAVFGHRASPGDSRGGINTV